MNYTMSKLLDAVEENMKLEAMAATQGTSRGVLALRVVKRVLEHLRVPVSMVLQEFKNNYIHRSISQLFLQALFPLLKQFNSHTTEETNAIEKISSCDYVKLSDLHKIVNVFNKRLAAPTVDENIHNVLYYIFAVDGVHGTTDLKGYIEHLQFGTCDCQNVEDYEDFKRAHVVAVRECILKYGWMQTVEAVKYFIFREGESEDTVNPFPEVLTFYKKSVGSTEKEQYVKDAILCQIKEWKRKSVKHSTESLKTTPSKKAQTKDDVDDENNVTEPKAENSNKGDGKKRKKSNKQNQNENKKMKKEASTENEENEDKTVSDETDKLKVPKDEVSKKAKKSAVSQKNKKTKTPSDEEEKEESADEEENWGE